MIPSAPSVARTTRGLGGSPGGPLHGLTFAAKDVFDIAGSRTGFGNPTWLESHPPALATAPAVQRLLDAGADMVGKTVTDELTYSLSGQNAHYGTPVNSSAPGRICGGSSSGSASAVAGGMVDFAMGTDCGGSVRLPASYCGILGIRPTHGRISLEGVSPFTWSFDVAGWFARDAGVFAAVGKVLLDGEGELPAPRRLLFAEDAFGVVDPEVAEALAPAVQLAAGAVGQRADVTVSPDGLTGWFETFRVIQAWEIWYNHAAWISEHKPDFGPGIRERVEWASRVTEAEVEAARDRRDDNRRANQRALRRRRCALPAHLASRGATGGRACRRVGEPGAGPGNEPAMHRRAGGAAPGQSAPGHAGRPAAGPLAGGPARLRFAAPGPLRADHGPRLATISKGFSPSKEGALHQKCRLHQRSAQIKWAEAPALF